MTVLWNLYLAIGLMVKTNKPLELGMQKFSVEINHKHICKFYMEYCLHANSK
jgi:hypothetical protein